MNKLKYASSPYLLQHANNPVHWQEWGEEAFALAKNNGIPEFFAGRCCRIYE